MPETSTLTIRIDQNLKHALEEAAAAEDRNVTDFVIRSVKARMAPQCPTCGRSDAPASLPAGLTPAMDAFLKEAQEPNSRRVPVVLTTLEAGQPRAYHGIIQFWNEDNLGAIVLQLSGSGVHLPVPRGLITGWSFDLQKEKYQAFLRMGYANGNALGERFFDSTANRSPRPRR